MQPAIAALNHLLAQNPWALPRLAPFKGRTVRFMAAPFSLACTIGESGALHVAGPDARADAECRASPAILARLALGGPLALELVKTSGDTALVQEILFLARNLRWDAAEDLSRFTGDIAAERILRLAQSTGEQARRTAANLGATLTEYWTEERPLVAKPHDLAAFNERVAQLRDSIEALERRLQQVAKAG